MDHPAKRLISLVLLLAVAAPSVGGCAATPADFGITGPSPGQSLTPSAPAAAELNPDAAAVIPGVRTGGNPYAPSVRMERATPGKFFGSD